MLIHPWDTASEAEWRPWLAVRDFGQLIASGRDRDLPVVVPTHFLFDGDTTVRVHLARPNPIWAALAENPNVLLAVVDDYDYVPAAWGGTDVPTSYYAAVHLVCTAVVIDDPAAKADLLTRQLAHFEPPGGRTDVSEEVDADRRQLPGIRGLELTVRDVQAKFKYGGNKSPEVRARIAEHLSERAGPHDAAAREHLLSRGSAD
ncbi:FMN-binding negative transcriptional regulator [Umezawaea endophytica]|uniref:FMN-binding negative transcriptional regulator n=1 Tax=Umezawaea endophytica TaxID=1654476 RepID=A0A9X3A3J7_9PSEU|nr:FMN-binding negative transcriptional regulator [Umezawaea endophytica]MCS7481814.1 FMN-binding negative transcriptional regulator [Umezawaea endophytica]